MATNISGIVIPSSSALSSRQAQQFQQMRQDGELLDFVVRSNGGREFKCHRLILGASSEYFRVMFRSEMKEAASSQANLDVIPAAIVELLIDHMYHEEVSVPDELLRETIEACDYLHLLEMKEMLVTKAENVIVPSNVVPWRQLAEKFQFENLAAKCAETFQTSLPEVSKSLEFLQLSLSEASSYLDAKKMSDVDPDDHLEATMDWVQHDPDDRVVIMHQLLEKIRLLECSIETLETQTETRAELFKRSPEAMALIMQASLKLAKQGGARKKRNRNKKGSSMIVVLGGHDDASNGLDKSCWKLCQETMQLEELCKVPDGFGKWCSVCKIPTGFAVSGGHDSVKCAVFLALTKTWMPLASFQQARHVHGSAFARDRIFLFGGSVNGQDSSSVISLNPDEEGGEWRKEADLPYAVTHPEVACAKVNGRITPFLLATQSTELFSLDMETNAWSQKTNSPYWPFGARMIAVHDNTLLVAGRNDRYFARYCPDTDTWVNVTVANLGHEFGALVSHGQSVYLLGGEYEDRVEEYKAESQSWSECKWRVPKKLRDLKALNLDM